MRIDLINYLAVLVQSPPCARPVPTPASSPAGAPGGHHCLPLARIKKIMKSSGDDVSMIAGEAPIVFSKACELFIEELTLRSWQVTLRGKRKTLHHEDVADAVVQTDIFDFLVDLVSNTGRRQGEHVRGRSV